MSIYYPRNLNYVAMFSEDIKMLCYNITITLDTLFRPFNWIYNTNDTKYLWDDGIYIVLLSVRNQTVHLGFQFISFITTAWDINCNHFRFSFHNNVLSGWVVSKELTIEFVYSDFMNIDIAYKVLNHMNMLDVFHCVWLNQFNLFYFRED